MRVKISTTLQIIVACAVLHNIAIDSHEPMPPQVENDEEERLNNLIINDDIPIVPDRVQHQQIVDRRRLNARDEILQRFHL